ncbi:DUF7344 domain-containing protein [Halobacterium zhouii]|uniref:DUF7344 domain-containing protein n=1 Tax=Halobacterium zhouii TaxID=2902624 RepID=UPI001E341B2C|nr:hypothetical protein [Halobacterium zhouii]
MDADARYHVLANDDRQRVLHALEGTSALSLEELVEAVIAEKQDESTRRQVKIALVHQHLPMLDDAGVVDYDRDEGTVTHSERALEDLLELL